MRRVALVLAVLASWSILLLWAARVDPGSPFLAAEQREFPGDDFTPVFGAGAADSDRLRVTSASADFTSLQSLAPSDVDAASFPTLRYRFESFPRTLELSLVFRTTESAEDIAISLPWPGEGTNTFDLSQIPQWQGHIEEIGFAEFPVAQLVPPEEGFRPFELAEASLWSRSWRGDLAALSTDWLGAWPWTQRSVHALGRDTDTPRARSLVLCVAIALGIALAWIALLFGRRTPMFATAGLGVAVAAWLALDVVWHAGLWGRLQTTRAVYAPLGWSGRENTVADTEVVDAADDLKTMLRDEPASSRILVYADANNGYELLRFVWHALPLNVAVYAYASFVGGALPERTLIVFYRSDAWRTNPFWRKFLEY
ncbi:MAG TPA: hypothetical protein VFL30_03230, partial [Rhodanobacteraceae bacterium]|nr:hypothetical protein [Rhodanobacteraceae bacterium]